MIDKIVPRPSKVVEESLTADGIEGMEAIVTKKGGYTAAFVNAERPQYLVIEDKFPNGRPPLDKVGVMFCDRETVNKVERMKVTTCLNPLHTAMSVNGCLLGYTKIADEMKDADIVALVKRLGYVEGLPVVTDPGIIKPKDFLDEVVEQRLPNVFMPDDPRGLPRIRPRRWASVSARPSRATWPRAGISTAWSACLWLWPAGCGICWESTTRARRWRSAMIL